MSETIRVPDLGGEGQVIEILVKEGDQVEAEQGIVTLESEKASMDVPSPKAGKITKIHFKMGDTLKEGDLLIDLEMADGEAESQDDSGKDDGAEAEPEQQEQPEAAADDSQDEQKPAASQGGSSTKTIKVPDLGGEGEVIEILVNEGDQVEAEQGVVTLESEKASMDVPVSMAGKVTKIYFKMGDTLKEGDLLVDLETSEGGGQTDEAELAADQQASEEQQPQAAEEPEQSAEQESEPAASGEPVIETLKVPDLGGEGQVIEILVNEGDEVEADQGIVTLESEKASMDVPSLKAGKVTKIHFKMGDTLKEGDPFIDLETAGGQAAKAQKSKPAKSEQDKAKQSSAQAAQSAAPARPTVKPYKQSEQNAGAEQADAPSSSDAKVHAGPAVRKLAREFGVDLAQVKPTGPKDRIVKEDVQNYVKSELQSKKSAGAGAATGGGIEPVPAVDYSKFGEIEEVKLSRLRQIAAVNLHRSWVHVTHVTQFESVDITEAEAFRKANKAAAEKAGTKLTLLPILMMVCARLLKEMPDFNSALNTDGNGLIHRKYVHMGFAVDTPDGLLVPVIRDADQKSLLQLAAEAAELAEKARNKKLTPKEMQGACFTISSLGHIGGTAFTPIVNAPEVAILGVSRATMQPVWDGEAFQPRLMVPLSLSYDHRVINGAAAAQFTRRLGELLSDIRRLLL